MKKTIFTFLLAWIAFTIHAQEITLSQAVSKALVASPAIKKIDLDQQKNQYGLSAYKSAYLPQVAGQLQLGFNPVLPTQRIPDFISGDFSKTIPVQFGTFQNHQATINVNQMIYNRAYTAGKEALMMAHELSSLTAQAAKEQIAYSVASMYYQVQGLEYQKNTLNANIEQLTKLEQISDARYRNGLGLAIDTDRIRVNINNLKSQLVILDSQEKSLKDVLNLFMGQPAGTEFSLENTFELNSDLAGQLGFPDFSNTSSMLMLDKQKEISEAQINVTRAQNSATVGGFVQLGGQLQGGPIGDLGDVDKYSYFAGFGFQLNVPIYNGRKTQYQVEEAKITLRQIDYDKEQTVLQSEQRYLSALQSYRSSLDVIGPQTENVQLAERSFNLSTRRYEQGIAPLTEVIEAQNSVTEAQNMLLLNKLQAKIAEVELINSKGEILNIIK